jgi:hypothetical protein
MCGNERTRRSTPALPNASFRVAISEVSMGLLLAPAFVELAADVARLYVLVWYDTAGFACPDVEAAAAAETGGA